MSDSTGAARSTAYRVGWWVLFVISVLFALNHAVLLFVLSGEEMLFLGWTALSLYSALVLYFPYRRNAKWAWYSTWILVATFAVSIAFDSQVGLYYLVAAAVMALGQMLTRSSFFPGSE